MPCYNSEEFIEDTLQCIMDIDYPNWECVMVNDGSTDGTQQIMNRWCSADSRFLAFMQTNAGPSVARNHAISKTTGKYILPLDSDDLISKRYVSEAVEIMERDSGVKLVYCRAKKFGYTNKIWRLEKYSFPDLLIDNMIFNAALYRREDFYKTRGYDETMRSGREDWEFWIELLKGGGDVHMINAVHFFYRTHKKSHNRLANQNIEQIRKYVYNRHKELYVSLLDNPIQLLWEHRKFKKKYNILRRLLFQRPLL